MLLHQAMGAGQLEPNCPQLLRKKFDWPIYSLKLQQNFMNGILLDVSDTDLKTFNTFPLHRFHFSDGFI